MRRTTSRRSIAPKVDPVRRQKEWWTSDRKPGTVDHLKKHTDLPDVTIRAMMARWSRSHRNKSAVT